ncbi:uncharacterized protein LAESUDRAFT_640882, partial [Laetiporus sulphureus 93-53]
LDMEEMEYWAALGDDEVEAEEEAVEKKRIKIVRKCQIALHHIKIVIIISMLMHSQSQKCNALAAVNGLFFHSCNTPDKVIKALAHMGISISPYAIGTAVHSLSRQSAEAIQEIGQSLLAAYSYDNFDINLPMKTPRIEKSSETLLHLTSSDILLLDHGVMKEDLHCSQELWERSPLNFTLSSMSIPRYDFDNLLKLHPESAHLSNLTW